MSLFDVFPEQIPEFVNAIVKKFPKVDGVSLKWIRKRD